MTEIVILLLALLCLLLTGAAGYLLLAVLRRDPASSSEAGRLRDELAEARRLLEGLKDEREGLRLAAERAREEGEVARRAASGADEGRAPVAEQRPAPVADEETNVLAHARAMEDYYAGSSYPSDLLLNEHFGKAVALLAGPAHTPETLLNHARSANVLLACMALEALGRRSDAAAAVDQLLRHANDFYHWPRFYALRTLHALAGTRPVLADLLARLDATWTEYVPLNALRDFAERRAEAGERPSFGERLGALDEERAAALGALLAALGASVPRELQEEFARWRESRVDVEFLKSFGRVWSADEGERAVVLPSAGERAAEVEAALRKEPARSVLLVGEPGAGKTTLARIVARRLQAEGWTVFEAGAGEVLAGQKYLGELEGRVQTLLRQIEGKRVVWFVPGFAELLWAGQHQYSPTGLLDLILPAVESGRLKVVGLLTPAAYAGLVRSRPKLRGAVETVRVEPTGEAETLELARRWAEARAGDGGAPRLSEETLREAVQLTRQYMSERAAPGNLMLLLDSTDRRLAAEHAGRGRQISIGDLLVTLSQLTGLPTEILDDRAGLDLAELRAFFARRVLGQHEAVECLVERVAMIKAGLTDPTRPQGVFLFVGPTGTGKTEIAKTLAEFLFGSPDRMIRLDMSELQTPESLDRILGETYEGAAGETAALVNAVRRQPFSVILLDEFEKAHPNVWDLFLQVFDDGRLTDRRGATADFRHSVVIMTSNLGATLPAGASIGFSHEQAQFTSSSVERAVGRSFRREFLNRIDRVVVFRPLSLGAMRDILRKELADVLSRRGFRTRQWAVEWDESAIDFLLRKGFTADLGARPLKRAVERYLLAPLSLTIVNHQFPEGDQFLFVRAGADDSIEVEFVDPDAPSGRDEAGGAAADDEDEAVEESAELRVESIALDARGAPAELVLLRQKYEELRAQADSEEWRRRKSDALDETSRPDFWDSPARFAVLGAAEYMDRIETGLATAGSLLARLTRGAGRGGERARLPADLVERLAQQLYLIDAALTGLAEGLPRDAFLRVEPSREAGADAGAGDEFARRVARMYRLWAERRRMRFEVLEEAGGEGGDGAAGYRMTAAVSGFGAYRVLRGEAGLHVLETPQGERAFGRARAHVRVVAQPDEPAAGGRDALLRQAAGALDAGDANAPAIVRRYREEPSPLVRDSARGWRTGRLERVLGGDFDLIR